MMQWPEVSATVSGSKANALISQDNSGILATASPPTTGSSLTGTKQISSLPMGGLSMFSQNLPFCLHPLLWSRDDVQQWLKRCIEEYSFTDVKTEMFGMNGKALVLLKKEDFVDRAPYAGDVLYNVLQKLLETHNKSTTNSSFGGNNLAESTAFMSLLVQSNPFLAAGLFPGFPSLPFTGLPPRSNLSLTPPINTGGLSSNHSESRSSPDTNHHSSSSTLLPHSPNSTENHMLKPSAPKFAMQGMPEENQHNTMLSQAALTNSRHSPPKSVIKSNHISSLTGVHNCKDEPLNLDISSSTRNKGDCRLLWEFISKLLKDPKYTEYIRWENPDDYTFRIVNPSQLSKLWGIQKNRTNMTYEKLSRALRYYYRMDIIEKVPGRRLTYRFMRPPHEIKRGQRGAKPGVPRKSRSTDEDDETEEIFEREAMESIESELSDDESHQKLKINEYQRLSYLQKDIEPMDLVNHDRYSSLPHDLVLPKQENITPRSKSLSPAPPFDQAYNQQAIKKERDWNQNNSVRSNIEQKN